MNSTTSFNIGKEMEYLLKPEEVAKVLKISRSKAYQLLSSGEIEHVRLGSNIRVTPESLADYIRTHTIAKND